MSVLARITYIDRRIKERGFVTKSEVMEEFDISDRAFRYDLDYMRNNLDAPVTYDRNKKCYVYTTPFSLLDFSGERILITLSFLQSILRFYNYVPEVSEVIVNDLRQHLDDSYKRLSDKIVYKLSQVDEENFSFITLMIEALRDKKQCKMTYSGMHDTDSRVVEPLELVHYTGAWYLAAYCHTARAIRLFKLSRIEEFEVLAGDMVNRIDPVSVTDSIDTGFGIYIKSGEPKTRVTIRYYGNAYQVMKRRLLHDDQKRTEGKDKTRGVYVEFTVPVNSYYEIMTNVLRFGTEAEAVSPPDFRNSWQKEIRSMFDLYCNN